MVGIKTYDPLTLAAVVVLLAVVGLAACYVPSIRATRVDPLVSLRYERWKKVPQKKQMRPTTPQRCGRTNFEL